MEVESVIGKIETKKSCQDFVNENNNKNRIRNKNENNKENKIQYNNDKNKENHQTYDEPKTSNKMKSNDNPRNKTEKRDKDLSNEVKRKATTDKASNTWITTMKKETKKARLVIKAEPERRRDSSSNNGKPTATEVGCQFLKYFEFNIFEISIYLMVGFF